MTARALGCGTVAVVLIITAVFVLGAFVPWLTDQLVSL